ncbi:Uncharacterised protein [Mycobacteroides abscessus subsp. massiliense]|nr:Uncharacterised protein [Mycobacteroides abscessus subsp. massiliense]
MRKATKQELEDFIRVNDFGVDGIYDKDSAIKHFRNASKQFKSELNQYKQAYQHCVDDLIVLRANNKRLERENEKLKEIKQENEEMKEAFQYQLEKRLQYFNKYQQHKALNTEFSQHIGNKPASSTYKYFRAKLDDVGVKEDE